MSAATTSAQKAAALYDRGYAERYRAHDDTLATSGPYLGFVAWLQRACGVFGGPIDVLELGCGTGRYFSALPNARSITGIDASAPMLELAKTPYRADQIHAERISLIHGDLLTHRFDAEAFDFVYSIGVLAEHAPLTHDLVTAVARVLKKGGRFAFSTVHPESPSIAATPGRTLGRLIARLLPGRIAQPIRDRLLTGGMYADERFVEDVLEPHFVVESLERFVSEAHLHCLCVAKRRDA